MLIGTFPVDITEDISENTLQLVDSFAVLNRAARGDMLDIVRILLEKEIGSFTDKAEGADDKAP